MRDDAIPFTAIRGRDMILALAQELRSLRDLAREIPVAPDAGDEGDVIAAQGQDRLEQTLDELAAFLARSAFAFGDKPLPDLGEALAQIRLAALAQRLAGSASAPADAEGELELL